MSKHPDISSVKHCLTEEQLLAYSKNQLSPKEESIVESHIASCEICSDVLDGILLLNNPDELLQEKALLDVAIDKLLFQKKDTKKSMAIFYRVAAVAIILTMISGIAFLYHQLPQNENNEISKNEEIINNKTLEKPISNNSIDSTQITENEEPSATIIESKKEQKNLSIPTKENKDLVVTTLDISDNNLACNDATFDLALTSNANETISETTTINIENAAVQSSYQWTTPVKQANKLTLSDVKVEENKSVDVIRKFKSKKPHKNSSNKKQKKAAVSGYFVDVNGKEELAEKEIAKGNLDTRANNNKLETFADSTISIKQFGNTHTIKSLTDDSLHTFIKNNFNYQLDTLSKGTIELLLLMDKTGQLREAKITKSLGKTLDNEALRIIHKFQHWKALTHNNQIIDAYFKLEIIVE